MASLTQVAITTRKIVRYSIYFVIFLIVGRIALNLFVGIIQKIFPPQAPAPTVQFGKLPAIPFDKKNTQTFTYSLETPEGGLPKLASQAKVYFMPQSRPDLLALDNAKKKASSLGYASQPTQISQTLYRFQGTNTLSNLEMNIITGTFSVGYNLNADNSPLTTNPPSASEASTSAKNFLTKAAIFPDDLSGPVTSEFLKIQNKQLVSAISLSEANFTKVNLYRKDYDKLPAVTQTPDQANVWFIISGNQDQGKQIINAQFYYYPIDETQYATYPLKTTDVAFKELQAGNAMIANPGNGSSSKITIRRIYLAYFDPASPFQFYQPVIVFEGDNGDSTSSNFVAYVPAVTSAYYTQ